MKKTLFASTLLTLIASSAFATSMKLSAIGEFNYNSEIQQQIADAQAAGLEVESSPTEAIIGGGCGFTGCDVTSLVTLATHTKGANPRTRVIAAIVTVRTALPATIKVIDAGKILELMQ